METITDDGLVLCIERVFPLPRTAVYSALTDPEQFRKWWGPRGFTAPQVDFDPQVGGSYRIAMQPPEGDLFYLSGDFQAVEPPARLAFTFRWDPPHPDDRDTLASLTLEERGPDTAIRLTQGTFATEERLALHESGWTESFERLAQLLGKDTASRG
jgi:uncharacterized protein YndB with AHSA1/START domain